MADEITDTELNELLSSVGNRRADRDSADPLARTPLAYDFKRPQRVSKEQSRLVESLHEQFARMLGATLSSAMRAVVDVDLAFTDQALYGEFILSLPHPCTAYSFTVEPPGNRMVVAFSPDLLMAVVDRAFGGKGVSAAGKARPLTPIETNVVNKLATRVLQDLETAWESAVAIRISDTVLETNPEFIQAAGSGDPVLFIALEVNTPHASGLVHLCYPLLTLEPLLAKLGGRRGRGQSPTHQDLELRARALAKVKVPVVIRLAKGTLPLKDLARLQPGDVVKLDTSHEEPAVVFLGKQPKYLGKPGLDGRQRAVKIVRLIGPEEEDLFR